MSAPNEDHAHHLSHDTSAGGGPPHRDVPPPLQPKGVSPGGGARPSIRRHQQLPPPEPLLPPPPPPHEPLAGAEVPPPPSDPRHPAAAADLRSKRSHYNHKALLEIRRSLVPFAYAGQSRSEKPSRQQLLQHLSRLGHDERQLLRMTGLPTLDELLQRIDVSCSSPVGSSSGTGSPRPMAASSTHRGNTSSPPIIGGHLVRKQSFDYDLAYNRVSPALESSNASTRSESPGGAPALPPRLPTELCRQYPAAFSGDPPPPPLPPPRSQQPSPQLPSAVQQRLRRMSPVSVPSRVAAQQPNYVNVATGGGGPSQPRGASPMIVQNGPAARQQLTHQMQALCLDPPPYPHLTAGTPPPPSYSTALSQTRQSPTQPQHDYSRLSARQSPSVSPISCSSTGSLTPVSGLHSYPAFQAKAHSPIIMQSVKSTHVQKPVLQTAVAPTPPVFAGGKPSVQPPTYSESVQGRKPALPDPQPAGEPPTYQETLAASRRASGLAADQTAADELDVSNTPLASITNAIMTGDLPAPQPLDADDKLEEAPPLPPQRAPAALPRKPLPPLPTATARCDSPGSSSHGPSPVSFVTTSEDTGYSSTGVPSLRGAPPPPPLPPSPAGAEPSSDAEYKMTHQSPIPERRRVSREREAERSDGKVKLYSPQAFKFFMEQHVENLQKSCEQRQQRRRQLESEMSKSSMPDQARNQIRRMLYQKESNFIRLKRAKMNRRMFKKLRVIGVGAFGEVSLVRKIDTNHLYAMKTLRKTDVLKRNQVAHVKAERDILAEAENEWVVKLYYSFQDRDFLYFVMDYIPGGDLMSLLIKFGIFEERLARFYIVELTCALEYVHKMGFIHRDIKPDNVLIDRDGHIKLTDFGLCTGFRWTHNSKYYTSNEHARQDSMELVDDVNECRCSNRLHAGNKPLERRRRREHQRCEAHSLVGTPNYIAPEVLMRTGYTQLCDWWSVGVILYEMLVGQPPFLASTPAETQLRVINWAGSLKIPKQAPMSAESRDLICRLLTGADRRIGTSAAEVKVHPFFAGIDFDHVRRTPAPYVPKIRHDADTSNFDAVDGLPQPQSGDSDSDSGGADGPSDAARSGGGGCELPDHPGFFEFTFRRFFDGHVSPSPHKPVDDPVYV